MNVGTANYDAPLFDQYAGDKTKVHALTNQRPQWNDEVGMWSLGFEGQGRVVLASAKNFVMEDAQGNVGFQFGKQAANAFTVDFTSPLSPFLAFAYALTFFEL